MSMLLLPKNNSISNNNNTNLTSILLSTVEWQHPLLWLIYVLFCVVTVSGNVLVVVAVFTKKYLQNPTGYLIVSLAAADLLVGLVVMPVNSVFEMATQRWVFESLTFCDIWHSIDILASTASIWNLCVISLDRFVANKDPLGYPDKVTIPRIFCAIVCVWTLSASLSFPAIAFWRISSPHLYDDTTVCAFTDNVAYVLFSSLVSFYIPLFIILFAYGAVFRIASQHSKQLKRGHRPLQKGSNASGVVLRVHYGRAQQQQSAVEKDQSSDAYSRSPKDMKQFGERRLTGQYIRQSSTESPPSTRAPTRKTSTSLKQPNTLSARQALPRLSDVAQDTFDRRRTSSVGEIKVLKLPPTATSNKQTTQSNGNTPLLRLKSRDDMGRKTVSSATLGTICKQASMSGCSSARSSIQASCNHQHIASHNIPERSPQCSFRDQGSSGHSGSVQSLLRRKTSSLAALQRHKSVMSVKRRSRLLTIYLKEQRAAQTLGMVVGLFVVCWLPFFIVNILIVMCTRCVHDQRVFTWLTWLGHLNSSLNPIIYSRFSREFRRAFKELLCDRSSNYATQRTETVRSGVTRTFGFAMQQMVALYTLKPDNDKVTRRNTVNKLEEADEDEGDPV